jgi:DNA-nicking Smr family endonuclease
MAKDRESRPLSKNSGKRGRGQSLSEDERALWEHAARDLKPIKGKKQRVTDSLTAETEPAPPRPPSPPPTKTTAPARREPPPPPSARTPARPSAPEPAGLDRRTTRQIGSGRMDIEARIDLHGMRQSEAHTALRRFLLRSHAADKRLVLVITGKGGPSPQRDEWGHEIERGVLRRNVPRWLQESELAAIVVGFSPASLRHGGEGALYVRLRKRPCAAG